MNLQKSLSDSVALVAALISDIEASGMSLKTVEAVVADPKVQASLAALVADMIG